MPGLNGAAEPFEIQERHGYVPVMYGTEQLETSVVHVTDGAQEGAAVLLDIIGRASGAIESKGAIYVLTPPMLAELIGELVRSARKAWGDDLPAILRQQYPDVVELLGGP